MDWNFDHQMSLSKRKCLFSNNCLCFLQHALPLAKCLSAKCLLAKGFLITIPFGQMLVGKTAEGQMSIGQIFFT